MLIKDLPECDNEWQTTTNINWNNEPIIIETNANETDIKEATIQHSN